jgi:hypothetical protein
MKIWEPKPPGTLWATPGLLWDSFTFTFSWNLLDRRHVIVLYRATSWIFFFLLRDLVCGLSCIFCLYVCMYYWPVLTHKSEIWTLTKRDVSRLKTVEMEYWGNKTENHKMYKRCRLTAVRVRSVNLLLSEVELTMCRSRVWLRDQMRQDVMQKR